MVIASAFVLPNPAEDFMGEVKVAVELVNLFDREDARRGRLSPEKVRRLDAQIVVDTGATSLVLPQDMVEALGLGPMATTQVEYADGRVEERPVAGMVAVRVEGREARVDCIVGPPGSEPLLGQIVLEITDLLVDCSRQRLVPRPESPYMTRYMLR